MSFSAAATGFRSFQETKSRLWRSRWTMQVCTVACGKTAVFGALVLFEPKPQDFLAAVGAHAERDMDSLISYQSFVADLDPQRVEEDQRVDRFQRPRLPSGHLLQHRISDCADQIGRDVDPVEIA